MAYTTQDIAQAILRFLDTQEYDGFAIQCSEKSMAEKLLPALHTLGRKWSETQPIISETGAIKLNWKYKSDTCYRFFISSSDLFAAQRSFYEKKGLTIYSFEELMQYAETTPVQTIQEAKPEPQSETQPQTMKVKGDTETKGEDTEPITAPEPSKLVAKETVTEPKKQEGKLPILQILGLVANEPFQIKCEKILLFYPNTLYRINEIGMREYLADAVNGVWIPCNDERELSYLINHPEIVKKGR